MQVGDIVGERAWPWIERATWAGLPLVAGPALAAALDPRSDDVRTVASVGLWLIWAGVLLALVVPRPWGLVPVRLAAVGSIAAAIAAASTGEPSAEASVAAVVAAIVVVAIALAPETGFVFVNGAAYGDERRFPLRPPGATLIGPLPLAAVAVIAGCVTGPLLLAAHQWVAGAIAVAIGAAVAVVGVRALHALCLRWVVLVPAGLVLKDHLALLDPVLFRRGEIVSIGPAPVDTDALDLTAGSPGLAVEVRLAESVPLVRARSNETRGQPARALLCTPTRPGRLLAEASTRRIRVG